MNRSTLGDPVPARGWPSPSLTQDAPGRGPGSTAERPPVHPHTLAAASPRVAVQMYPCALGLQPIPSACQGGGQGPCSRKPLLACWTSRKGPWAQLGAPRHAPWGGTRTPAQQGLQVKPPELLPAPTVLNPGVVLWKHRTTGGSWDGFQPAGYGLLPGLRQAVVCPLGQKLLEVCVCAPGFAIKWAFGLMCHRIEHSVGLPAPTGGSGHDHRCLGTLVVTG